jgi:hypothetical protein
MDINDFEVTLNDVRNKISDEDIYSYYLENFEDNSWFSAPWRRDSTPSLRISYYKDKWVWCDFGEDSKPKDAISFVQRYHNVSFRDALQIIYNNIYKNKEFTSISKKVIKNETFSYCKIRKELFDFELDYWKPAQFTAKDLEYHNVYSGLIRHNGRLWHESIIGDPLFIYMFDKIIPIYKGYRPLTKDPKLKFYGKNISNHIQGLDKLPETGKILIITKSYKDVMVWNKLGYPAIAPHTENMFISPFDLYDLQMRFEFIYVNYDNDETGIKKSIEYTEKYNINYFNLPSSSNCKDVFEFVTKNNYNNLNNLFLEKQKRDEIL